MPNPATDPTRAPNRSVAERPVAADNVLLQTRQLAFDVNGRTLWRNFDLVLREGERLGITGPSGSGKTLLLRTLAGLEPLQHGELVFCGRAVADWSMPTFRARVQYVPQRPALREGTVQAVLRAPFEFHLRRGRAFPDEQALALLRALGRDENFLRQRVERLSGGESQIVAMLRALLVAPDVLLLDEPTASLDAVAVSAIEQLVAHWISERPGRACLWTSHDRAQLERVTDYLLTIENS